VWLRALLLGYDRLVNRFGYQTLGYAVWKGAKWYVHRRYGDAPRKVALGGLAVLAVAALVLAGRRVTAA
jgi:hypothetical protein